MFQLLSCGRIVTAIQPKAFSGGVHLVWDHPRSVSKCTTSNSEAPSRGIWDVSRLCDRAQRIGGRFRGGASRRMTTDIGVRAG